MRLCLGITLEDSSSKSAIQSKDNVLKTWLTEARDVKPICKIEHAGCASRTMCIENNGRPARQKEERVGAADKNTGASWDYRDKEDWIYASGKDSNRSRTNMGQVGGYQRNRSVMSTKPCRLTGSARQTGRNGEMGSGKASWEGIYFKHGVG